FHVPITPLLLFTHHTVALLAAHLASLPETPMAEPESESEMRNGEYGMGADGTDPAPSPAGPAGAATLPIPPQSAAPPAGSGVPSYPQEPFSCTELQLAYLSARQFATTPGAGECY